MISRFIIISFAIYGGLLSGYFARKRGYVSEKWSKTILKVLIICIAPTIISFSLWTLELTKNLFLLTLPLVGAIFSLFLMFLARLFAKFHKHNSAQTGSYLISSIFSNVGYSWGGFLCLLFLGEKGFALSIVYSLYINPMKFQSMKEYIKEYISISVVKFLISPVVALFLGCLLGYSRILNGLPLKVLFVESCMPVALAANTIANLFNTERNLTNACWLFTMVVFLFMAPFIYVIVNLL